MGAAQSPLDQGQTPSGGDAPRARGEDDRSIAHAWGRTLNQPARQSEQPRQVHDDRGQTTPSVGTTRRVSGKAPQTGDVGDVIAVVNGHPIRRERVLGPLLRSRGVSTLEQVLVLDEAGRLAEQKGLTVTHAEVENEYGRALRQLVDPFAAWTTEHFDPVQAERILDAALAERNMSREEFRIGIRRNAYLRKIVESELRFTQKQLQAEYARTYGRRVQVRHIQLAGAREVEQVRSRLAAGEDFGAVARQFSANTMTASHGGLLDPFCETDDDVPELFRRTAFALRPGEVSKAIRIGPWIHILKWQRTLPAEHPDPAKVRTLLEEKLRDRQSDPAMAALYDRILKEANVRIIDPTLKHAYEATRADQ